MDLRSLRDDDDRASFSCGDRWLDDFLHTRAGQGQFRYRASVTYVLAEGDAIAAFVTVLPGTVRRNELGSSFARLPPSALPVLVLARMGVRTGSQREGLGSRLLAHVFGLALDLADRVGCIGVIVDAKDGARTFYEKHDFVWLATSEKPAFTRGFLPIQTIEQARRP